MYKTKLKTDGSLDKYKERLISKSYNQIEGIDYTDTFAPVSSMATPLLQIKNDIYIKWMYKMSSYMEN